MDRFAQYAFVAAREAIEDAALPDDPEFKKRVGGIIGSGIGGILTFWQASNRAWEQGTWAKTTPFFIPMLMGNAAPAHISMAYGFQGPFFAVASASSSSSKVEYMYGVKLSNSAAQVSTRLYTGCSP